MTATLHLQGIGLCNAIKAEELKAGDILSWNYSPCGFEVVSISEASAKFIQIEERSRETGKVYSRRLKKDRLVAATR